jgi:hypothetical protein
MGSKVDLAVRIKRAATVILEGTSIASKDRKYVTWGELKKDDYGRLLRV